MVYICPVISFDFKRAPRIDLVMDVHENVLLPTTFLFPFAVEMRGDGSKSRTEQLEHKEKRKR